MNVKLKIGAFALFVATVACTSSFAEAEKSALNNKGPCISCEDPIYNFGDKDESDSVKHTFILKNEGDAPLVIQRVDTSCGCTVARNSKEGEDILPGETTEIKARFNLRGRFGSQHKTIRVTSNDPEQPSYTLLLQGSVFAGIDVTPSQVYFRQLPHLATSTQTVTITSEQALTLTDAKSSNALFIPSLKKSENAENTYELSVITQPPLPLGVTKAKVTLSREQRPDVIVPVSVMAVGAIGYAPKQIKLSSKSDKPITRYVIVRPGAVKTFKILEVKPPDPQITVTTSELSSKGYRIRMENIPQTQELAGKELLIKTDIPSMPIIKIPFVRK